MTETLNLRPGTAEAPPEEQNPEASPPFEPVEQPESSPHQEESPEATESNPENAPTLESLMETEQINPEGAIRLARARVEKALRTSRKYAEFTPSVASQIAHHSEPSIEPTYPTAAQIKQESIGARFISGFLGFFSSSWANRFDRYLEGKARKRMMGITRRTVQTIDTLGGVAAPKQQFVEEVQGLHTSLAEGHPLQDSIHMLAEQSREQASEKGSKDKDEDSLLGKLVDISGTRQKLLERRGLLQTFAPEVTRGIERFLQGQGLAVGAAETSPNYSFRERAVRSITPHFLRNYITGQVEARLNSIHGILPEDGRRFKDGVYNLCKSIVVSAQHGQSGRSITQKLLKDAHKMTRR